MNPLRDALYENLLTLEVVKNLFNEKVKDAWAHPVLCNGRLYLRYHGQLWCLDVRDPDSEETKSSASNSSKG